MSLFGLFIWYESTILLYNIRSQPDSSSNKEKKKIKLPVSAHWSKRSVYSSIYDS